VTRAYPGINATSSQVYVEVRAGQVNQHCLLSAHLSSLTLYTANSLHKGLLVCRAAVVLGDWLTPRPCLCPLPSYPSVKLSTFVCLTLCGGQCFEASAGNKDTCLGGNRTSHMFCGTRDKSPMISLISHLYYHFRTSCDRGTNISLYDLHLSFILL